MIKERYCSPEVSRLLREKGFNEECDYYYEHNSDEPQELTFDELNYSPNLYIKAPTHQMACDWLRIVHKIHIIIIPSHTEDNFFRYKIIHTPNSLDDITSTPEWFNDYGKAVDAACIHALNFLVRQSI